MNYCICCILIFTLSDKYNIFELSPAWCILTGILHASSRAIRCKNIHKIGNFHFTDFTDTLKTNMHSLRPVSEHWWLGRSEVFSSLVFCYISKSYDFWQMNMLKELKGIILHGFTYFHHSLMMMRRWNNINECSLILTMPVKREDGNMRMIRL